MNQISDVERRKLLLKGWKLAHPYRKTQDEIDLEWVNKINKVKQNNKIAVLISSDELVEDFEDGSRLVQTSGRAIAYLIDASYFAFKKSTARFDKAFTPNCILESSTKKEGV